jgi:hypothetical protein
VVVRQAQETVVPRRRKHLGSYPKAVEVTTRQHRYCTFLGCGLQQRELDLYFEYRPGCRRRDPLLYMKIPRRLKGGLTGYPV